MLIKNIIITLIYITSISFFLINDLSCNSNNEGEFKIKGEIEYPNLNQNDSSKSINKTTIVRIINKEFDFGEITDDSIVKKTFEILNVGNSDLFISEVISPCSCTTISYPKCRIPKNKKADIIVSFNARRTYGFQLKKIAIISNTIPATSYILIKGFVRPKNNKKGF